MASGLQCPGCGHVHPAALPEIARGDKTFRCYGCYRTLSIPEGWTGRPSPRPASPSVPTPDAPPGAGLRDARAARLAGRRGPRPDSDPGEPTQMVSLQGPDPTAGAGDAPGGVAAYRDTSGRPLPDWAAAREAENWVSGRESPDWAADRDRADWASGREVSNWAADRDRADWASGREVSNWGADRDRADWASGGAAGAPAPNWPAAGATGTWAGAAGTAAPGSAGVAGARTAAGASTGGLAGTRPGAIGGTGGFSGARGATAGSAAGPLGWIAPRRSGRPVPTALRAAVWVGAFAVSLIVTAYLLRKAGVLDVNTVIDLFAGSGPGRFGVLVVMLPVWALLSATIAHFCLEALARRRRPRPARRSPTGTATPS